MRSKILSLIVSGILIISAFIIGSVVSGKHEPSFSNGTWKTADAEESSGVAATVDGTDITEDQISAYVKQYRILIGAENDTDWATLLDESGTSAKDVRKSAIDHFAKNIAIEKKASDDGIAVSDDEIDSYISDAMEKNGYADNADGWRKILETSGTTENGYREDVRNKLLADKLINEEVPYEDATEPQMRALANSAPSEYTGSRIIIADLSHGISSDASTLAKVKGEKKFRSTAKKLVDNGKCDSVEDIGWTCIEDCSTRVKKAADKTNVGSATTFTDKDGKKKVLFVCEKFQQNHDGTVSLNSMPDEIKDTLSGNATISSRKAASKTYIDELTNDIDIKVNDMPKGLDYDVDMSNSEYGKQKTKKQEEKETQDSVNEHLNELKKQSQNSNYSSSSDDYDSGVGNDLYNLIRNE